MDETQLPATDITPDQGISAAAPEEILVTQQFIDPDTDDIDENHPLVKAAKSISGPDLLRYMCSDGVKNLAIDLSDTDLASLGQRVVEGKKDDWESYTEWRTNMKQILDLVDMKKESKDYPWPGASNIKFPLIADAAMQFAARAYPEIIQGTKVVKCQVVGPDPNGDKNCLANKISEHMSWQILEDMPGWEADMDAMLHTLPVYGTLYKKTYYDPITEKNVSLMLTPFDCVVNANARSNADPKRLTHVMQMYPNDVQERVNAGIWIDPDLDDEGDMTLPDPKTGEFMAASTGEDSGFFVFLEQHRWEDLDGDGYAEPYIVTVHENTAKVVRIVAAFDEKGIKTVYDDTTGEEKILRITPVGYFTKYVFFPDSCGSWLGKGFGQLLFPSNMSINTILNQLVDSGTLANLQGGFRSNEAKIDGVPSISPGQWISTQIPAKDLASAFFPLPFKEPSQVLMQLLSMVVTSSKEFASISAAMSGSEMPANANATSVLAVLDQGLKVFNGIYKRLYRSLKDEFKKLAALNAKYLKEVPYFANVPDFPKMLGMMQQMNQKPPMQPGMPPQAPPAQPGMQPGQPPAPQAPPQPQMPPLILRPLTREDYASAEFDIIPVADPNMSTSIQKMTKIQAIQQWAATQQQGVNMYAVNKMFLDTMQIPNVDEILIPPDKIPPPPPDPLTIKANAEAQALMGQVAVEKAKLDISSRKTDAEVNKIVSESTLNMAKAQATSAGIDLEKLDQQLGAIAKEFEMRKAMDESEAQQMMADRQHMLEQQKLQQQGAKNDNQQVQA